MAANQNLLESIKSIFKSAFQFCIKASFFQKYVVHKPSLQMNKKEWQTPRECGVIELGFDPLGRTCYIHPHPYIPLWKNGTTLRWSFNNNNDMSGEQKSVIRKLLLEAIKKWEDIPITFEETRGATDFIIESQSIVSGLFTQPFSPEDSGISLKISSSFWSLHEEQQLITLCHDLGHIMGLRHTPTGRYGAFMPPYPSSEEVPDHSVSNSTSAQSSVMDSKNPTLPTPADIGFLRRLYDEKETPGKHAGLPIVPFESRTDIVYRELSKTSTQKLS